MSQQMFQQTGISVPPSKKQSPLSRTAQVVLAALWEKIDNEVPLATRSAFNELILENSQAFSLHDGDIGFTDIIQHEINTGDERPVRQPLRRQPLSLLPVINDQVNQMLQQGIIEPSRSAWASNVVMVLK